VIYLLYVIHVLVCVFLILVVLLQQGKGADLSVFGGGSTQTAFGARSATTMLHKLTVASFVVFILTTVSIALFKGGGPGGTVMAGHGKAKAAATRTAPAKPAPAPAAPVAPAAPAKPR
jgi:preprotein translocase subunit SecG